MRRLLLMMTTAALIFAGCDKGPGPEPPEPPKEDVISLDSKSKDFEQTGGAVVVKVTSSGESDAWELTGGDDWAVPSTISGKNGDTVTFTVEANEAEEEIETVFTFKRGTAEATFKITVEGKEPPVDEFHFVLVDPADGNISLSNAKGEFTVVIDSENEDYSQITQKVEIVSGTSGWVSYFTRNQSENGDTNLIFRYEANTTNVDREAEITFYSDESDDPAATLNVTVTQKQTDRLVADNNNYIVAQTGGNVLVKLLTNVDYEVTIEDAAKSWLSLSSTVENAAGNGYDLTFTAANLPSPQPSRSAVVTISQTDGDLSTTLNITQESASSLISVAANMNKTWAWGAPWNSPGPLNYLANFTLEALVYANTFTKTVSVHGSNSKVNTIAGMEGQILIRFGDVSINTDQLQVVFPTTNVYPVTSETKTSANSFPTDEWLHVAVSFQSSGDNKFGKVYVNGVEQTEMAHTPQYQQNIWFGDNMAEPLKRFYIGRSFDDSRFFDGLISEVRLWSKALTETEINAENHFYKVDPNSSNLVGYWKFNDSSNGTEGVIKDHTRNGNNLNTNQQVTWQPVSLP